MMRSRTISSSSFLAGLTLLCLAAPAAANLCNSDPNGVHKSEARELESEAYSAGNNCASGSTTCWLGNRDYSAKVIACNRERDVKPFKLGPIQDMPFVHKAAGKLLDDRDASDRRFVASLPPRMITGQIQYFNTFPKWYGYILERKESNWIATTILDFKFPDAEKDKLHLPVYLAERLSTTKAGLPLTKTVCAKVSAGASENGMIVEDWGNGNFNRACRIDRDASLFLLDDGSRTDVDYLDEGLGFTQARPATEWIMHYWRATLEQVWSRPDQSFQLKVAIANLAGREGEIDAEDLELYRRNDVVFEVELHHREGRANNMFRPIEVAGIKIYKAIYAGNWPTVNAHEFGHSLGLDDEYSSRNNPKADRDCTALSGYTAANKEHAHAMCDDWHYDGERVTPNEVYGDTVKSVYLWIVTQRYSIGAEIARCKEDSECLKDQYCKKPTIGVNRCVKLKAVGDSCTSDKQCQNPATCMPKPFGKCVVEGSKQMGDACINNKECATGQCDKQVCVCRSDAQCGSGFCDKGELTVGANSCQTKRANEDKCTRAGQCQSDRCYLGKCKPQDECSADTDCSSSEYCDKGTMTAGVNRCVPKKSDNQSCGAVGGGRQCQGGHCKWSRCYTPNSVEMGDTCYNDDACKEGKCSAVDGAKGSCVCQKDSDCSTGKYCDGGLDTKVNACRPKLNKGEKCGKAGSLGNDHKCKSGECSGFPKYECK